MPSLADLKKGKERISFLENKMAGILQPKAEPYKELAKAERIQSATYELPKGMREQDAMALTLGAIFNAKILDAMHTSSSAEGSKRSFGAVYVIENIFVSIETKDRLGNVPYKIGEARENAAKAFQKYEMGDKAEVKEMAATLVKQAVTLINNYLISDTDTYKSYGIVTKMAVDLLDNPEMELKGLLPQGDERMLRIFVDVYEMKKEIQEAEIQLKENLPPKNSVERENLVRKVLSENALISRYASEIYDRNSEMTEMAFGVGKKIEAKSEGKLEAVSITRDLDFAGFTRNFTESYISEMALPSQVMLRTEENKKLAIAAYLETIEQTETYKKIMEADSAEFEKLLEEAKAEKLSEVPALKEELAQNERQTQEIKSRLLGEFEDKAVKAIPRMAGRKERNIKLEKIIKELEEKKESTGLVGTVEVLRDYLSLMQDAEVGNIDSEKYQQYLESMETLVEQTEKFYEKDAKGNYVPLTSEGLTRLQQNYKEAYYLAKETGALREVCDILENNIIILGSISRKHPTSLPEAMDTMKKITLDVSENRLPEAIKAKNFAASVSYTDINGEERKGIFVNKTEQKNVKAEIQFVTAELDRKYKKLGDLGMTLRKNRGNLELLKGLTWEATMPEGVEAMSPEAAKEAFLDKVMENMGDVLGGVKDLIESNRADAIAYFSAMVEYMDKTIQQEWAYETELYTLGMGSIRVDNRSRAMSVVADLMGTPNLVAGTRNMEVTNGLDTYSGTFVEEANGIDVLNLPENHPMREYKDEVYDHDEGLKSLADLQVLDYICQNVNRNSENMAYQFDTTNPNAPKFVGVQGKASNTCFVMAEDKQNLTTLENLGVISQSVFESILQIDPEMFQLTLASQGLEKKEIEAASLRLENLKSKVLQDAEYFKDMPSAQLEKGRIRIVKDEDFKKLSFEKILDAAPDARAFQNVKENIMNGVPVSEKGKQVKRRTEEVKKIIDTREISFVSSEVNLNSPAYYQKLGQDLKKMLLQTLRVDDSKLRGSSKEFKNVQQSIQEMIGLVEKIQNPKEANIKHLNDSMIKIIDATAAYEKHKEQKSSGSAYEEKRIKTISGIAKAMRRKQNMFSKEYEEIKKSESVQEKKEVNKHQIKEFVGNLMNWNEAQSKENPERALATAILVGSMTDYAFKCFESGKNDILFGMSREQFENKVTELQQSEKFQNYYQGIDKTTLAENLASQKPIESYLEDFRKGTKEPQTISRSGLNQVTTDVSLLQK